MRAGGPWVGEGPEAVHREVADRLVRLVSDHPEGSAPFRLALSGGSTPKGLYRVLASPRYAERLPWDRVQVFFADERCVPPDHADSNYGLARTTLLDHLPRQPARVFRIQWDPSERECGSEKAAIRYDLRLQMELSGSGDGLDLALLGVGPDGHTASLFPGAKSLGDDSQMAIGASPPKGAKHPRVTLTLPFLRRCARVWFLVTGEAKAAIMGRILGEGEADLPAAMMEGGPGQVTWFLDRDAAALLQS